MAKRTGGGAPGGGSARADELSERELNAEINAAMAGTEMEVWDDALGSEPLDNDGDRELEEQGDGLEGEQLDESDEAGDDDGEAVEDEENLEAAGDEQAADGAEAGDEEAGDGQPEPQPQGQQPEPNVPSGRLREETRRAQAAEARAQQLERMVLEMNGRLGELSNRVNAPPPKAAAQERPPKPDMFAEPEAYEAWMLAQADERAAARVQEQFFAYQQHQQQQFAQRLDQQFAQAAQGPRGFEFNAAYHRLISVLDPRNPQHAQFVQGVIASPDPVASVMEWWEYNGGPEYRQSILEQLMPNQQQRGNGNGHGGRQPQQSRGNDEAPPRQQTRLPTRSLNAVEGRGGMQRMSNPEEYDGSNQAIWDFGTRRDEPRR